MAGTGGRREGAGRKKGIPNKITTDLKELILGALEDVGGRQYLVERANDTPTAFLTLIGKVLPMQVTGTAEGGAITIQVITGVPTRDEDEDGPSIHDA